MLDKCYENQMLDNCYENQISDMKSIFLGLMVIFFTLLSNKYYNSSPSSIT